MIRRVCMLFLVMCTGWSLQAAAQDRDVLMNQDLQHSLFAEQYRTILAGEREVTVVIREGEKPVTQGVAILMGEAGYSPLGRTNLAPLAPLLNQYGWVTASMAAPQLESLALDEEPSTDGDVPAAAASEQPETVQLPEPESEQVQTDEATAPDDLTEAEQPQADTPTQQQGTAPLVHPRTLNAGIDPEQARLQTTAVTLQIESALQLANEYGGFRLLVVQGTTAAAVLSALSDNSMTAPDALVVIAPFWPEREINARIPAQLAATEMPVLDIYSQWDSKWSKIHRHYRQVEANKVLKLHYRQRELIGPVINDQQYHLLSKEIYGWLTHMGW